MSDLVAALPMYDWPELHAETDARWATIRDALRAAGIAAPERLARRNADLPPVPGGIRDGSGKVVAPDPATLEPDAFDLAVLWRHPRLIFAQTCWGPMRETDLSGHVALVGQPDYSDVEGGRGQLYSSAVVMRASEVDHERQAPDDGRAMLPLALMRGRRFVANEAHSMSGYIALRDDLGAAGESHPMFSATMFSGGHRASICAVAEGRADVAAIDCRSWAMAQRLEKAAASMRVAGWTALRPGLPYIMSNHLAPHHDIVAGIAGSVAKS